MMRHEQRIVESRTGSEEKLGNNTGVANQGTLDKTNGYIRMPLDIPDSPSLRRRSKHVAKLNMGDSKDDIHVCIMCMRAIMNNKVFPNRCSLFFIHKTHLHFSTASTW